MLEVIFPSITEKDRAELRYIAEKGLAVQRMGERAPFILGQPSSLIPEEDRLAYHLYCMEEGEILAIKNPREIN